LTLQVSLAHYERVLSDSHPTYIAQLNAELSISKNGLDMALLYLTAVIICVSGVQVLTGESADCQLDPFIERDDWLCFLGLCSMNVTRPSNFHGPGGSFHVFGIVVSLSIMIIIAIVSLIRYWWIEAKKRHRKVL